FGAIKYQCPSSIAVIAVPRTAAPAKSVNRSSHGVPTDGVALGKNANAASEARAVSARAATLAADASRTVKPQQPTSAAPPATPSASQNQSEPPFHANTAAAATRHRTISR